MVVSARGRHGRAGRRHAQGWPLAGQLEDRDRDAPSRFQTPCATLGGRYFVHRLAAAAAADVTPGLRRGLAACTGPMLGPGSGPPGRVSPATGLSCPCASGVRVTVTVTSTFARDRASFGHRRRRSFLPPMTVLHLPSRNHGHHLCGPGPSPLSPPGPRATGGTS